LNQRRRVRAPMQRFAPVSVAAKYMELYRQLAGFRDVWQNGMLRHPDSQTRELEIPLNERG
jgi:hypothetical protein